MAHMHVRSSQIARVRINRVRLPILLVVSRQVVVITDRKGACTCMVITDRNGQDQPGKVANPARGQLDRKN